MEGATHLDKSSHAICGEFGPDWRQTLGFASLSLHH
jgi:hypothetical protein